MGGVQPPVTAKYVIWAKFDVDGVVEKPDVIGVLFGQTEGLFGPELDLRELQKTGRIGRIEIEIESKHDHTTGTIIIPSSLDRVATAVLAAAIESVDRVGPCNAKITIEKIEDVRETKRRIVIERAKEILRHWTLESTPSVEEILKEVGEAIKVAEVVSYGPEKLPAGPDIDSSDSIVVVEGRADVINLLKCGIRNVIAVEGAKIPEAIIKLSREKEVTAFLDGDRGGDLILKELLQVAKVDYVARAPPGREVEDLTPKEVLKALRERVPVEQLREERGRRPPKEAVRKIAVPKEIKQFVEELRGTLEAVILDSDFNVLHRVPVSELAETLGGVEEAYAVVFDGVITQRIVDIAGEKGVRYIVADRIAEIARRPVDIKLCTFSDVA